MRSKTIIFVSLLVMLMMACSLTTNTGGNPTNPGPAVRGCQPCRCEWKPLPLPPIRFRSASMKAWPV